LRFVHVMNMQVKHDLFEASTKLTALVEELVARGQIDAMAFAERRERIRQREAEGEKTKTHVRVEDLVDKYSLSGLPEIDCAALIPICKARCCTLGFPLSFQDLDEGVVEWDYALPYLIRQGPDKYCVHSDGQTRACTIYDKRPATCRRYDCRDDRRIWLDFEKKIMAPLPARMR